MSPSKKSAKRSGSNSSTGTLIVLAVVLLLGAFFILSGKDLLGIFGGSQAVNTTPIVVPTNTPKPIVPPTSTPIPPTDIPTPIPATATKTSPTPRASWWEVYFVSPIRVRQADEEAYGANGLPAELLKGSITEKLIQRIEKAKKTIHIASYEIDIVDVAKALARAKERGVDVRFITDDEAGLEADTKAGHGQLALLKKAGIQVIDDKRGALMHHKFWLFDGETTWTGSTNITISGMFEQDNNVIVIESPELTAIYERQFEDMWAGKFNAKSPSAVDQQTVNIKGTQIQVLFSPEDKAISKIVPYIQNAKKSVHFLAFTYTQPNLGKAMLDKAREGVDVKGVFETVGSDTEYSEMPPLYCAKVPVRQDTNFAFLHHKVIIVDEQIVITGSLNFTDNADQSNNENVVIIDNAEIAKLYNQEFQRIWGISKDPDPAKTTCK
ncbi:MAG: hypothetical protein EHM81_11850 [Chloroflexi bacterium]|nr:MAG: hypothetical protein EHM81_11850 [Chloroflexota bacterium]